MSNTNDFVIENGVLKRYKGFGRKVTIPEGVTSIGNQAFYNCNSITSITIPDGVKSIGNEAFYNCTGIKSVTLPSSVTYIGEKAFIDCKKLETISIPDSVTFLGDNAFENCIKLANVILSGSLTAIGDKVFSWCNSLTGITIPDGVTEIGERAFSNCKMLQSISIPDSLTKIDAGAFHGTEWYCNQPSGLIYAGKVAYGFKGEMTENTAVALDSGTIGIADGAFKNCQNLSGISIPDSLTRIGKGAFQNCKALQSIDVPESVTSIGGNAFDGTAWYDNQPDGLVYAGSSAYKLKEKNNKEYQTLLIFNVLVFVFFTGLFLLGSFTDESIAASLYTPNSLVAKIITSCGVYPFFAFARHIDRDREQSLCLLSDHRSYHSEECSPCSARSIQQMFIYNNF